MGKKKGTYKKADTYNKIKKEFIKEYYSQGGNISATCRALGISRFLYYKWLEDDKFSASIREMDESFKDFAEKTLYDILTPHDEVTEITKEIYDKKQGVITLTETKTVKNAVNTIGLIFYLKTKARDRGYIENDNNNNTNGVAAPPVITFVTNNNDR